LQDLASDAAPGLALDALRPKKLKRALLDMDIQAVNALLAEYAAMPLGAKEKEWIFKLEEHILMFEYDAAIAAIDALS
jgi:hypothetical protein